MSELDDKVKKTWDDVEKLKSQIGNILNTLKGNQELFVVEEAGLSSILPPDKIIPTPSPRQFLKSSNMLSKLSRQKNPNSSQIDNTQQQLSEPLPDERNLCSTAAATSRYKKVQFCPPVYTYVESETFLLPLLDRWFWGTTIDHTSKSVANFPDLTLSIIGQSFTAFSYDYNISLLEAEFMNSAAASTGVLDIPFQDTFIHRRGEKSDYVNPGCKALVTASFENPISAYSTTENRIELLATLTLHGRFQWSQKIVLELTKTFLFKDDIYKRFQTQIFGAMSQCQDTFRLQRLTQGNISFANAFGIFLTSLGFEVSQSVKTQTHVAIDYFSCDLPSLLFGVLVKVERNESNPNSTRCSISTRSPNQMQSLLRLIFVWVQKESVLEKKRGNRSLHISTLSPATLEAMRETLLEEIEILTHLVILSHKFTLENDTVVLNWLRAYGRVMERTDAMFLF